MTNRAALSLVAWWAVASMRAAPPPATFLGVVDDHGRLTPIAVYDGAAWWNRWPWGAGRDEIRNLPIPESLASIPSDWLPPGTHVPGRWRAFPPSGRVMPFRALVPERSPHPAMMDTVVIGTTYRGPGIREWNGPGDTLAISGPGELAKVVTPPASEQAEVLRQLDARIARLEADAIAAWKEEIVANGAKDDIALARTYATRDSNGVRYVSTRPPRYREVELVKAAMPGGAVYHLRSEKLFRVRPNDDCMMNLATDGFVIIAGKSITEHVGSHAYSEYCGDPAEMLFPLGTVTIGGHMWWIVKNAVEDGYEYGLLDTLTGQQIEITGLWELRQTGQSTASALEKKKAGSEDPAYERRAIRRH